eukprot:TRINITY_DN3283_c0_g1_i5.p1 TRINITY_DN3283_c0_g1~~TRINITY_DN3283_c0_g1_i5.p1  ORF type:complete len:831 (-),score=353.96 TRINITY_DN3283_c0_g1_i5:101-2593(-)
MDIASLLPTDINASKENSTNDSKKIDASEKNAAKNEENLIEKQEKEASEPIDNSQNGNLNHSNSISPPKKNDQTQNMQNDPKNASKSSSESKNARSNRVTLRDLFENHSKLRDSDLASNFALKSLCSSLKGKDGPILKYSEIFGPKSPSTDLPIGPSRRKVDFELDSLAFSKISEENEMERFEKTSEPARFFFKDIHSTMGEEGDEIGFHPLCEVENRDQKVENREGEEEFHSKIQDLINQFIQLEKWEERIIWEENGEEGIKQEDEFQPKENKNSANSLASLLPSSKRVLWGEIVEKVEEKKVEVVEEEFFDFPDLPDLNNAAKMELYAAPPEEMEEERLRLERENLVIPSIQKMGWQRNQFLEKERWEESIIWDDKKIPSTASTPCELLIDLNDKNIFQEDPTTNNSLLSIQNESSVDNQKKQRKKVNQNEVELDPFNISNDCYYKQNSKGTRASQISTAERILHSEPALRMSLYKAHVTREELASFHHPKNKVKSGLPVTVEIVKEQETQKKTEIRHKGDLNAKDGRSVLLEYIEQRPLIFNNIGMGSKLKNYYRKKNSSENPLLRFEDGDNVFLDEDDESPFLGNIPKGKTVQAVDNNMFRAPLFKHTAPETDFLLVRSGDKAYIKEIPAAYTVGQTQPKLEVPIPNSRAAITFIKNRLQAYIFRLFLKDPNIQVKINEVNAIFRNLSEGAIRKRLKDCADFQRGGGDTGAWVVKDQSQLPSEEDLRIMMSPELVCLYESMILGQYELEQKGVTSFTTIVPSFTAALQRVDEEGTDELKRAAHQLEEEILLTPWNLTSNFLESQKGKINLQLVGTGDPSNGRRGRM